jgi:glycerophosphoryl diester phosphodiesterase
VNDGAPRARPLAIAHGAGNDPVRLRAAEELGVDYVEADVWLHRDRLEVRHEKTAGPLPVLWDRWTLAPGWAPRLDLAGLVRAARPETVLLLDLKGVNRRLPELVLATLAECAPRRRFAVCSQNWDFVDAVAARLEVTAFYSVGNRWQLRALPARLDRAGRRAVSIKATLLDAATVRAIKERATAVVPWRVRTPAQVRQLLDWGVDGINADDLALLRELMTDFPSATVFQGSPAGYTPPGNADESHRDAPTEDPAWNNRS